MCKTAYTQPMPVHTNIRLLSWFNFFFNFRLYSAIAILYFSQVTRSYTLGISIFSIVQVSQALFEVPTGIYSDRLGRRRCLILGSCASVLSITCYAIGQWYVLLAIGAVFNGACQALFSGNNDALLYESLAETGQKEKYHDVLGKVSSTLELAGFIGVVLGGVIAVQSLSLLMWLSVLPQLICLAISLKFVEPSVHREKIESIYGRLKEITLYYRKNARLRNLSLAGIIGFGVGEATWSFQAVFYNSVLPVWAVSFVMSLNFLASTISYRLSGRLINRFKAINLLIYSEIYTRILVMIALIQPTVVSPFLMAAASIFYGPGEVAKNGLLQQEFTPKQRATMASINSLVGSCFFAVFAILIGLLADRLDAARSLLFAQVCLLPIVFLYLKVFRADRHLAGAEQRH